MSKKRKTPSESFKLENTSLYNKTDRDSELTKEELLKLKKRKRTRVIAIFVSLVVLLVAVPTIVIGIITSPNEEIINSGEARQTYQTLLELTEATDRSTELYNMRNPELTDTEAVTALIAKLQPEEELGSYTVMVKADEKPYTVTLKFDLTHDTTETEDGNKWETEVIKYSAAIMGLIDNIAQVSWEFPLSDGTTEGSFFNRADAEKLMSLNVPVSDFGKSPTAVQLLLNQLGIDLY